MSLENAERVIKNISLPRNKATPKCDQYRDIHYNTVIKSTLAIHSKDIQTIVNDISVELNIAFLNTVSILFLEIDTKSPNYMKTHYACSCLFYEIIMESEGL